jgi:hypothetical protein
MNKKAYIESIQYELSGGNITADNKTKFDRRIIAGRCDDIYKLMLNEIYLTTKRRRDYSVFDLYCKPFTVAVSKGDDGRYYSDLPKAIVSMPLEVVIRKITPIKDAQTSYIPISTGDVEVLFNLPVGKIGVNVFYYIEHDRIYYFNMDRNITDVNMRLVINFSDYEDTDTINTPTGTMGTLFERVVQSLRGIQLTPEKQINDNQSDVKS